MPARPQAVEPQRSSRGSGSRARPTPRGPARSLAVLLAGTAVLATAILPYASTLGFDFVWDDRFVIGTHLDVSKPADLVRIWKTPFDVMLKDEAVGRSYFRPVTLYSLALDRAVWKDDASGYHAQNLFWYAAACFFLWLLAWEISGRPVAAAAGTALFALHPTHPESVAFISGRTDVLAAAFLFASLWTAVRFGPGIRSPWLKLLPAALVLAPGVFAKEVAFFGAPLLPLVLWLGDRRERGRDLARSSAVLLPVLALYYVARLGTLGPTHMPAIAPVEGTTAQILTSVAVVARYLPLLFVPIALSARHEIVETRAPDAVFAAGLLTLLAIAAGLVLTARRRSWWLFPIALYAATLLPVTYVRILSGAIVAERFLFIPSAAVALAVALLPGVSRRRAESERSVRAGRARAEGAARDAGPIFLGASGAVAIWLLALLLPRVALWENEGTLFSSMLRDSPESPHVHGIVGGYYYRKRDLERAAYHYRRSYELYPRSGEMLLNLVAAEDEMGQTDSAMVHVRQLIRLHPDYAPTWYALGNLHVRLDQPDSARMAYEQSIRLLPEFPEAENNLGAVLERMARYDEALAHYRRAFEILPGYPEATRNWNRLRVEVDSLRVSAGRRSP